MSEVQTIKARVNQMIEREIERCKKQIGDVEWEKHRDWVTENIVAAAKAWIARQAAEGRL
jgi:ABC-type phosphate transport system auxiliary subunit